MSETASVRDVVARSRVGSTRAGSGAGSGVVLRAAGAALLLALGACASLPEPIGPMRAETVFAVTASNRLVSFNAGQPQRILASKALQGLNDGEAVVAIDYRVAYGQLYAFSSDARLLRIDTGSGEAQAIGAPLEPAPQADSLEDIGFDFNPTVDRIRVVTRGGLNLRLHPQTGAPVDADATTPGWQPDGKLRYEARDEAAGMPPVLGAAAYTYNKEDEKITTNYAIDAARGTLVMQGTREGVRPVVSPNTGILRTVGSLGLGAQFSRVSFDIADVTNAAFAAITPRAGGPTRWVDIDLASGRARVIGTIGVAEAVNGIAIEP